MLSGVIHPECWIIILDLIQSDRRIQTTKWDTLQMKPSYLTCNIVTYHFSSLIPFLVKVSLVETSLAWKLGCLKKWRQVFFTEYLKYSSYFWYLFSSLAFSCSLRPAIVIIFVIQFVEAALKTGHHKIWKDDLDVKESLRNQFINSLSSLTGNRQCWPATWSLCVPDDWHRLPAGETPWNSSDLWSQSENFDLS